jgi:hypothetical protein
VAFAAQAERFKRDGSSVRVETGQSLQGAWQIKTGLAGGLVLVSPSCRLEFQGPSENGFETARENEVSPVQTFLKPVFSAPPMRAADSILELRQGTLLAEVGMRPVSLNTPDLELDARNVVFAITVAPQQGTLVSILKGQVKIRTEGRKVSFLGAGKSMRAGAGGAIRLTLLDESAESQEHQRGLTRFVQTPGLTSESATAGASVAPVSEDAVGISTETRFDLNQRRRAALLTPPSIPNIGLPEVSPELPVTQPTTP